MSKRSMIGLAICLFGLILGQANAFYKLNKQTEINKQVQIDLAASRFAIRIIDHEMKAYKQELEAFQRMGWDHMRGKEER